MDLQDRPYSQTQLFCSNLPWSVNGKLLRQSFEVHGEVVDAFVAYNGRSSRGFGYVTFKDAKGAAAAAAVMNGVPLGDDDRSREIRVEMARERPGPRPEPKERSERTPRRGERIDGRGRSGGRGEGRGRHGEGRGGRSEGRGGQCGDGERPGRGRGRGDGGRKGAPKEPARVSAGDKQAKPAPATEESSES